jgi:isoleucyl-tRNA synthetase
LLPQAASDDRTKDKPIATMPSETKTSYKQTLNLPQSTFPMEAKLTANEPIRLEKWRQMDLYRKLMDARSSGRRWVLHDGPPFANGDIHIGHLINKTLKDVIQRFRSMQGFQTPYVPGWDCHGLPIEHKIQQELGPKVREMEKIDVRKKCYAYAEKYVGIQSEQFQRLGILGDWANPYLTMKPGYEAATLEVFARFVEAGLVYKQLKPVHWSIANQTALAEAELEYKDIEGPSIYVEFLAEGLGFKDQGSGERSNPFSLSPNPQTPNPPLHFLVWTTTPWTLPANLAIAVHPEVEYALVRYTHDGQSRLGVVAAALVEQVFNNRPEVELKETIATAKGSELVGLRYRHPFIERSSPIVAAKYVTTTDGTGLVHTAPGHGEEDYVTGINNGLEIYCPVLHNGRFDDTVPEWIVGMRVWEANPVITEKLRENGVLLAEQTITHSYPHDWRSKTPTIFRATEQWFIALDKPFELSGEAGGGGQTLRRRALSASGGKIEFIPKWGQARLNGMLESRPDWCISRQRAWGLPIPVFYNEKGEPLLTGESVRAVGRRFAEKGSDAWFTDSPADLLGNDFQYPDGFAAESLRKEKDIFDVWFESGSSWHAVLQARDNLKFPADLYLEGSDQHRGWFQLSLLPALGAAGEAPFKQVLTHGFVVKPDGTKVSKSDKEYVTATQEVNRHGADLLRLWCCSVDYQGDIPASPKALAEFADKYRKIRNTLRYLLSNLYDFDPARDAQEIGQKSLDGWASAELASLIQQTTAAYDAYQTHKAFRLLHEFCTVQISAVYGNAMKDRLYCDAPDSPLRRRCQTVMYNMLIGLTKLLAPMLVFTADEVWDHIPHKAASEGDLPSVHLAMLPAAASEVTDEQREEWKLLMELREQALGQLDKLKKEQGLNKAIDAEIVYLINDDRLRRNLQVYGSDLEDLVGAGHHTFAEKTSGPGAVEVQLIDRRDRYAACARSWKRRPDVGEDPDYPDLCLRDAKAMRRLAK